MMHNRCMMHNARCTIGSLEFFHSFLVNLASLVNLVKLVILSILQY